MCLSKPALPVERSVSQARVDSRANELARHGGGVVGRIFRCLVLISTFFLKSLKVDLRLFGSMSKGEMMCRERSWSPGKTVYAFGAWTSFEASPTKSAISKRISHALRPFARMTSDNK